MRYPISMILFLCVCASVAALPAMAESATVTTLNGDVYYGDVTRDAETVRVKRPDGSVLTFPPDTVASVVPVDDPTKAIPPLAAMPAVAQPVRIVQRAPVTYATVPSPPPPPVPGTSAQPTRYVRTAAPRVVDVERSVMTAAAADAACQDPCYESPWTFRGGLALGLGQGNSDFFDFRIDGEVVRDPTPWGFKAAFTYVYGSRDGEEAANNWKALFRGERAFSGRNYVFGQVLYERDVLAQIVYRWTLTAGVGRTFIDTRADTFKGEIGVGATIEKRNNLEQTGDPSGWLGLDYEHKWTDDRRFTATYAFRPNFADFDLSASTLELKYFAPCFSCANLVIGLRLDHVIDPPGEDIESLDLLFTVGLTFER